MKTKSIHGFGKIPSLRYHIIAFITCDKEGQCRTVPEYYATSSVH